MIKLYIDADVSPVENEVFRVGRRHGLKIYLVFNSAMRIPPDEFIERTWDRRERLQHCGRQSQDRLNTNSHFDRMFQMIV